jgi:putative aminopeptidase FrvX
MNELSLALLEELTQADGVPGHEEEVRRIFEERLRGVGEIQGDRIGNIFCIKPGGAERPRIRLDSHLDEVGFIVQRVLPSGFIKFVAAGGWWEHTLPAQRVRITTDKGKVLGVIGATPPHLLADEARRKVLDLKELYIDVGAESADEAAQAFGVQIRLFDPTMIACPKLCDLVVRVANECGIRHQIAVRQTGGTDAGAIHQSGRGVPSVVLGVPTRYIHSHVSIISIEDYRAARDLLLALLPRLDADAVASLA